MAAHEIVDATVEIRLTTTGVFWLGDVEAQGAEHLRVRLRADEVGVLPSLAQGTFLECALDSSDGRYYVDATVLDQNGARLWLHLPPVWRRSELRHGTRRSGGFAVTYRSPEANGTAACIDISTGGMRVRMKVAPRLKSRVELIFTLPGEALPVQSGGLVRHIYPTDTPDLGMDVGLKFVDMPVGDGVRIARYCRG